MNIADFRRATVLPKLNHCRNALKCVADSSKKRSLLCQSKTQIKYEATFRHFNMGYIPLALSNYYFQLLFLDLLY